MKHKDHVAMIKASAASYVTTALSIRASRSANTLNEIVTKEVLEIKELGYNRRPRSGDELISENKLWRFIETHRKDRSAPPMSELRGVRRKDVFFRLRKVVDDWYAERAAREKAYQEWLAEKGGEDQSHLLKNGWIAFLEGLPGPDIHLWHGVATDFHDLFGDRMDAAFWIVEQEECDRATVSDFIMGFLVYRLGEPYADITKREKRLDRFLQIIEAYNAGFYRWHSIAAGLNNHEIEPNDTAAAEILDKYETAQGLANLPRPTNLLDSAKRPVDSPSRGYTSPYAFWDDAGLHLEYPGPDWRNSA